MTSEVFTGLLASGLFLLAGLRLLKRYRQVALEPQRCRARGIRGFGAGQGD